MKRLLSVIVVLAFVAGACSDSSGEVIATVGDVEITQGELAALYESDTLPIDTELRDSIFRLVAREVLISGIRTDFGDEIDQAAVDTLYDELVTQMEAAGMTPEEFMQITNAGLGMVRFNAEIGVIRDQVIEGIVTEPETLELFFSDPATYTTVCARHILVATQPEADDVLDRLEDGEEFAVIAAEVSLDSPTGELGCSLASRYVAPFADATLSAEIGEYTEPVESSFGFHVIIVDERTAPTEEEFAADPLAYLTDDELNTLWSQWLNDKLDAANVTVNSKYGEWTDVGIVPPGDSSSGTSGESDNG